jgi:hypothetical protein
MKAKTYASPSEYYKLSVSYYKLSQKSAGRHTWFYWYFKRKNLLGQRMKYWPLINSEKPKKMVQKAGNFLWLWGPIECIAKEMVQKAGFFCKTSALYLLTLLIL